jgi:hypothetical protein
VYLLKRAAIIDVASSQIEELHNESVLQPIFSVDLTDEPELDIWAEIAEGGPELDTWVDLTEEGNDDLFIEPPPFVGYETMVITTTTSVAHVRVLIGRT